MNQAARKELNRLDRVLPIANVAALDVDHAHDGVEHRRLEVRVRWQADRDDGSVRAHVPCCLLEGAFADGEEDYRVGAEAVGGCGFDVFDDVFGFGEVDVGLFS